jgi:hypothetical protein
MVKMNASAELRWFFPSAGPAALSVWFHSGGRHGPAAGGGRVITDTYHLGLGNTEVGVKQRRGEPGLQIKLFVEATQRCEQRGFEGPIEVWVKNCINHLTPHGPRAPIEVHKRRWRRLFDCTDGKAREMTLDAQELPSDGAGKPQQGCFLELTELDVTHGAKWVTLAFEAFGPLDTVAASLCLTAAEISARSPPSLEGGVQASYPSWLPRAIS